MAKPSPTSDIESFELDREKHIVISSKVYEREALPENARQLVATVNYADQEIAVQEQNLSVYKYGRDRMVNDLIGLIEESDAQPIAEKKPEAE